MHQHIRELIAENEINEALEELRAKNYRGKKGARVLELRRRWSELRQKDLAETEHARDLRIEENRFVKDFIHSLDWLEEEGKPAKVTPVAVTESVSAPWLKYVVGIAALLLGSMAVWYFLPSGAQPPELTEVSTEAQPTENDENVTPPPPDEQDDPEPQNPGTTKEPTPTIRDHRTPSEIVKIDPEIRKQLTDATAVRAQDLRVNTTVYAQLMSKYFEPGAPIDIAVAAYRKTSKGSNYDKSLSESITNAINKQSKRVAVSGALIQSFHDSEFWQAILYGRNTDSEFTNPRAKYVLLVEVRPKFGGRSSDLGFSIYDTKEGKPQTRSTTIRGSNEKTELLQIMTRLSEWSPGKFQ